LGARVNSTTTHGVLRRANSASNCIGNGDYRAPANQSYQIQRAGNGLGRRNLDDSRVDSREAIHRNHMHRDDIRSQNHEGFTSDGVRGNVRPRGAAASTSDAGADHEDQDHSHGDDSDHDHSHGDDSDHDHSHGDDHDHSEDDHESDHDESDSDHDHDATSDDELRCRSPGSLRRAAQERLRHNSHGDDDASSSSSHRAAVRARSLKFPEKIQHRCD
jgi:hypothetical protein